MNLGTLIATLGISTAGLRMAEQDMKRFEARMVTSVNNINRRLQTTGATMKKFGRSMTMYMTVPLALVGGAAFKMHMSFESSMSKIVGLVGIARIQVDEWGRDIMQMAPKLGKAPKELADALYFITSAGIRGAAAMDVLEMSAKASAAGLGETKIVADLVTSAVNAYGIANMSAARATDILTATVREGKAEADALAGSMGMVLPIASYMGAEFNEVGAAIAAMTRTGTGAQTASMQLRQIFMSLVRPMEEAERTLDAMGTSSAKLRQMIREDGLLSVLMKLRELTKEYGETVVSTVIPNVRALSGVLDIIGNNLEDNVKLWGRMEDVVGATEDAFGAAAETAEFKLNQALSAGKVALTELGSAIAQSLIPVLERATTMFQRLADWFRNLDDSTRQLIVRIGGLVAVAGPLLVVLGFLVGNVLPGLIRAGMSAVKMFNALKIAMLANPITAIAIGIAALATYMIVLRRRTDEVRESQNALNNIADIAIENTIKQRVMVEQLLQIAQDETEELEKREAALRQLNRISPEYFGNLSTETINTINATEAKKKYIRELIREAKVKAASEALFELEKKAYRDVEKLAGARLTLGQKVMAGLIQSVKGVAASYAYMGMKGVENLDLVKEGIDNERLALEELMKELVTAEDFLEGGIFGGVDGVGGFIDPNAAKIMEELRVKIVAIGRMGEYIGDEFDVAEEKSRALNAALEQLARLDLSKTDVNVANVLKRMQELGESTFATEKIIKDWREELSQVDTMNRILGDSSEMLSDKLRIHTQVLKTLVQEGYNEWDEAVQMVKMAMEDLNMLTTTSDTILENVTEKLAMVAMWESALGDRYDDVSTSIQIYTSALQELFQARVLDADAIDRTIKKLNELYNAQENLASSTKMIGSVMSGVFVDMLSQMGRAFAGVENAWWGMVDSILRGAEQIVRSLLTIAIASIFKREVTTKGVLGLATAAVGIGVLMGMWSKYKTKAMEQASIPRMAEGGIVTRPTLIMAGENYKKEAIIPLDQLDRTPQPINIKVTVEGIQRGEDIYYIVKEIERRHQNSF